LSKSILYHGVVMVNGSRETHWDTEKLVTFENGTSMVLMKTRSVPQRWLLLWVEPDGTFGKRDGHSELVLRATYREICQRLAVPEVAKIEDELLDGNNTNVDRKVALFKRRTRLLAANDKFMDGLEAKDEALLARIQRLPEGEREAAYEGIVRDALAECQRLKAEDTDE
jgi:hypothetical protein